ncbi:hypothetical protein RQP46_000120 [Phenoliferia psychrophenolica]
METESVLEQAEAQDVLSRSPPELVLHIFRLAKNPHLTTPLSKSLLRYSITMCQDSLLIQSPERAARLLSWAGAHPALRSRFTSLHLDLSTSPLTSNHYARGLVECFPNLTSLSLVLEESGISEFFKTGRWDAGGLISPSVDDLEIVAGKDVIPPQTIFGSFPNLKRLTLAEPPRHNTILRLKEHFNFKSSRGSPVALNELNIREIGPGAEIRFQVRQLVKAAEKVGVVVRTDVPMEELKWTRVETEGRS